MFPTSGYFKGIDCPYFQNGLCERPWCHFRHIKSEDNKETTKSVNYLEELGLNSSENSTNEGVQKQQSLLSIVGDAIQQVQKDIDKVQRKPVNRYMKYDLVKPNVGQAKYKPTPINKETGNVERTNNVAPKQRIPVATMPAASLEYRPTPIHLLKQRNDMKLKNNEGQNSDYDPVTNFSTQKCPRVTLGNAGKDFTGLKRRGDKKDCLAISQKRQRLSVEAKFSSDEDNPETNESIEKNLDLHTSGKVVQKNEKQKQSESIPAEQEMDKNNDTNKLEKSSSSADKTANINQTNKSDAGVDKSNDSQKLDKLCEDNKAVTVSTNKQTLNEELKTDLSSKDSLKNDKRRNSDDKEKKKESSHSKSHKSKHSKSEKNQSRSSSHKHKSKSSKSSKEKDDKRTHKSKTSSSKKNDNSKSSSSKHSSSKSSSDKDKKSSYDKTKQLTSNHSESKKIEKERRSSNIFEALMKDKSVESNDTVSHQDLFGNDSDSEQISLKLKNGEKSDSDDSDFLEISSVSSNNSVRETLLANESFEKYDESDICNDIFQSSSIKQKENKEDDEEEIVPPLCGKVRISRASSDMMNLMKEKVLGKKPKSFLSPAQVMHNRFLEMQKRAEKEGGKKQSVSLPKPASQQSTNNVSSGSNSSKRIAHVPQANVKVPRPVIPKDFGSKVPSNVRQNYLNKLIDECQKIYPDDKDAFDRALAEERAVYERASSKMIYLNVCINTIKRLRDEIGLKNKTNSIIQNPMAMSHKDILGGKGATSCTYTLNRSGGPQKELENLEGLQLYNYMKRYVLTEAELVENGFPRTDDSGKVVIKHRKEKRRISSDKYERICCRCGKRFVVLPTGEYKRREDCVHHWGKCWKKRIAGSVESYWTCCQGSAESTGCQIAKYHVNEDNKMEDLSGYVETKKKSPPKDGDFGVYAMDCEMVYTTAGSELARVTVVDCKLKPVLDKLVKPDNHVVDYNTRFSGLTKESLKGVKRTLKDIQSRLRKMFSSDTILLGHSLESDLVSLKMIHATVVDTSVVFPHRLGAPQKRALRNLASEILGKSIQEDAGGHDSHEDAAACMELMLHKIKQSVKRKK